MCMVSLYLLAILCCHTIDWDIFLRYWCLSQLYYYILYYYTGQLRELQLRERLEIKTEHHSS